MLPVVALAQTEEVVESSELTLGETVVAYDEIVESEAAVYYYVEGELVASEHESVWLVYEDEAVVLEAHDTTGDGEADTFVTVNDAGVVSSVTGEGAEALTAPEIVAFEAGAGEAGAPDLVGDVSKIKGPGEGGEYVFIIAILLIIGAGLWWWMKRRQE